MSTQNRTNSSGGGWLTARSMLLAGAVVLVLGLAAIFLRPKKAEAGGGAFEVRRGDFLISVVEPGTLQAVNEVSVRSEVEGSARVIFIVPEGTYVKKGDLLVELDSAAAQDEVNQQRIAVEKAQFALIAAEKTLAIQKSVAESEIRAAELKLEFAEKDYQKFVEGEKLQELRKAENDVGSFKEKLAMDEERLTWSKKLYDQGFETKSNLDRDQLTHLQTQISLQMATNALWLLQTYDHPKMERQFQSAMQEAEAELQRVKDQAASKIAQYEADVRTQEITYDLSKDRLDRFQKQLTASRIEAPQDGLVVYAVSDNRFSSESLIEEGATVRNRQTLIKLPDISAMKLSVKIHESHINMIKPGLPAYVKLDSMPDQRFRGVVSRVGLLPDTTSRWGNPNLKVYATEILIRDPIPDAKPGISASAEIIVTNLQNVVTVPIQAVATRQGKPVVYLAGSTEAKPVPVQVGLYNTKFIEVVSGLEPGQKVLLAPPFDTRQKDLAGGIVGEGDVEASNLVAMAESFPVPGPGLDDNGNGLGGPEGGRRRGPPGMDQNGNTPDLGLGGQGTRLVPQPAPEGQPGEGGPRGQGGGREGFAQMRAQFDKDGDGELNQEEQEAMRAAMRERFGQMGGGGRRRGEAGAEGGAGFGGSRPPGAGGEGGFERRGNRGEDGGAPREGGERPSRERSRDTE